MPAGLLGKATLNRRDGVLASFATDIRPLFRDSPDVDSMQGTDLIFPLMKRSRSEHLKSTPAWDGSMPCDEPWPPERLAIFRLWMDEGFPP